MARITLLLLVLLFCLPCPQARAAKPLNTPEYKALVFKGEVLSKEIARTTGIALNPILCMSALGAYRYFSTDAVNRATLPWHAQPLFWGSLSVVLFLIFLKDSGKLALPKVLMVPLDAAETLIEKKGTALLALPLLFSLVYHGDYEQLHQVSQQAAALLLPVVQAAAAPEAAAAAVSGPASTILTLVTVYALFGLVWVVSHALNMLILLSPFSLLDLFLATTRNSLAGAIMVLAGTLYGTALALVTIAVSVWLFPRALRLVIFGTIVSFDLVVHRLPGKKNDSKGPASGIGAFTSCSMGPVRPRTYAVLGQQQGRLVVTPRPFILWPGKTFVTPVRTRDCALRPGLLSATIVWHDPASHAGTEIQIFRLRPRYCLAPEQVAAALAIPLTSESSLAARVSSWITWLATLFQKPPRIAIETFDA
jgi:hypothetical protein